MNSELLQQLRLIEEHLSRIATALEILVTVETGATFDNETNRQDSES